MSAMTHEIGTLWIEGRLGWIEILSLKSHLRQGYDVTLYHYGDVEGVPDGVDLRDAREILDTDYIFRSYYSGSPALHADKFRYHMLTKRPDLIWVDLDVYCLRKYEDRSGYIMSWGTKGLVFISVLKFPAGSPTLHDMVEFTEDPYPVPPWETEKKKRYLEFRRKIGLPVHVSFQKWTVWGSRSLTYFMKKNNELEHVMPEKCLYPVAADDKEALIDGRARLEDFSLADDIFSVHLYAEWLRMLDENEISGKSLIMDMLEQEGVKICKRDYEERKRRKPGIVREIRRIIKI